MGELLMALSGCDVCLDAREDGLYALCDDGRRRCAPCWKRIRSPFPTRPASELELHESREKTVRRMIERGGTDRHLARNGKT